MPRRDGLAAHDAATALIRTGWLSAGERVDWICPGQRVGYEVTGRKRNGRRRAHLWLRILGWVLLSPLMLILLLGELFNENTSVNDWDESADRGVIAKGHHPDCLAARLADVSGERTFWVLTERRFAFVAANGPPPTGLRTVWELPSGQYVYHQPVTGSWRRHPVPTRIAFADGSDLVFRNDPRP